MLHTERYSEIYIFYVYGFKHFIFMLEHRKPFQILSWNGFGGLSLICIIQEIKL